MNSITKLVLCIFFLSINFILCAQTIPTGSPVAEEAFRRNQLLGLTHAEVSFHLRPLHLKKISKDSTTQLDHFLGMSLWESKKERSQLNLLPVQWITQYNSQRPYGWNDGALIPSRGAQTYLSWGLFAKAGPLSIQFKPEVVWASNSNYEYFSTDIPRLLSSYYRFHYNAIDQPGRFGESSNFTVLPGQSFAGFDLGPLFLGVSTQNIWWGPGKRNTLILSNNSPGFLHYTLNTTRPAKTLVGSFEGQVIIGKLEPSGYKPVNVDERFYRPFREDWRYYSGFMLNYSPSWIKGLHIGASRVFQQYYEDTKEFGDYFPALMNFLRSNDEILDDEFNRDQLASIFARWVWQKAKTEFYFEFGRNDASWDFRDFIMTPEHSRAYILGFSKVFPLHKENQLLQLNAEITQLQQNTNYVTRNAGAFYIHSQVRHGYTHRGQVLGAGIGPGSNLQSIEVNWIKGLDRIGLQLERLVNNNDFYYYGFGDNSIHKPWVDLTTGFLFDKKVKNLTLSSRTVFVHSLNYQWKLKPEAVNSPIPSGKDKFNLFLNLNVIYHFAEK